MSNLDFRERVILGRTGLEVSRLGIGSGYGIPAAAVEKAFHEKGINYLYWGCEKDEGEQRGCSGNGGQSTRPNRHERA